METKVNKAKKELQSFKTKVLKDLKAIKGGPVTSKGTVTFPGRG